MLPGRSSDAGPDCVAKLCRCGRLSSERADCCRCDGVCCPDCSDPLGHGWLCHRCLNEMANIIVDMIEADSLVCDDDAALAYRLLADAGCTLPEAVAHMRVIERKVVN